MSQLTDIIEKYAKMRPLDAGQQAALKAEVEACFSDAKVDVNAVNSEDYTALMLSLKNEFHEVSELLLAKPGININYASKDRSTALRWAAIYSPDFIPKLLGSSLADEKSPVASIKHMVSGIVIATSATSKSHYKEIIRNFRSAKTLLGQPLSPQAKLFFDTLNKSPREFGHDLTCNPIALLSSLYDLAKQKEDKWIRYSAMAMLWFLHYDNVNYFNESESRLISTLVNDLSRDSDVPPNLSSYASKVYTVYNDVSILSIKKEWEKAKPILEKFAKDWGVGSQYAGYGATANLQLAEFPDITPAERKQYLRTALLCLNTYVVKSKNIIARMKFLVGTPELLGDAEAQKIAKEIPSYEKEAKRLALINLIKQYAAKPKPLSAEDSQAFSEESDRLMREPDFSFDTKDEKGSSAYGLAYRNGFPELAVKLFIHQWKDSKDDNVKKVYTYITTSQLSDQKDVKLEAHIPYMANIALAITYATVTMESTKDKKFYAPILDYFSKAKALAPQPLSQDEKVFFDTIDLLPKKEGVDIYPERDLLSIIRIFFQLTKSQNNLIAQAAVGALEFLWRHYPEQLTGESRLLQSLLAEIYTLSKPPGEFISTKISYTGYPDDVSVEYMMGRFQNAVNSTKKVTADQDYVALDHLQRAKSYEALASAPDAKQPNDYLKRAKQYKRDAIIEMDKYCKKYSGDPANHHFIRRVSHRIIFHAKDFKDDAQIKQIYEEAYNVASIPELQKLFEEAKSKSTLIEKIQAYKNILDEFNKLEIVKHKLIEDCLAQLKALQKEAKEPDHTRAVAVGILSAPLSYTESKERDEYANQGIKEAFVKQLEHHLARGKNPGRVLLNSARILIAKAGDEKTQSRAREIIGDQSKKDLTAKWYFDLIADLVVMSDKLQGNVNPTTLILVMLEKEENKTIVAAINRSLTASRVTDAVRRELIRDSVVEQEWRNKLVQYRASKGPGVDESEAKKTQGWGEYLGGIASSALFWKKKEAPAPKDNPVELRSTAPTPGPAPKDDE